MKKSRAVLLLLALSLSLTPAVLGRADDAAALYEKGLAREAARDFAAAVAAYGAALDLDEEHDDAFVRWDYCQRLVPWQEALAGPPAAGDLVALGELWFELGRHEDERNCYEDAIGLDAACADAHGHLALWNYTTRGGSFDVVYRETLEFLRTSPHRDRLAGAIADFEIYGALRNLPALLGERLEAFRAAAETDPARAAEVLEGAADPAAPEGVRQWCLYQAATMRRRAGDDAGARRNLGTVLAGTPGLLTQVARLLLAEIEAGAGRVGPALEHLRAAVAEGSGACARIGKARDAGLVPVFASDAPGVREARERLLDVELADEPLRAAIRAAEERAGREGKRVLLHWYGPYCPFVMAMEERLADPRVRAAIDRGFVYVRMDQGSMHRGLALDAEYGDVMARMGVPGFFVLDPDGTRVDAKKDIGLFGVRSRCYSVDRIVEWLERNTPEAD